MFWRNLLSLFRVELSAKWEETVNDIYLEGRPRTGAKSETWDKQGIYP
jgi:hypothetical protein